MLYGGYPGALRVFLGLIRLWQNAEQLVNRLDQPDENEVRYGTWEMDLLSRITTEFKVTLTQSITLMQEYSTTRIPPGTRFTPWKPESVMYVNSFGERHREHWHLTSPSRPTAVIKSTGPSQASPPAASTSREVLVTHAVTPSSTSTPALHPTQVERRTSTAVDMASATDAARSKGKEVQPDPAPSSDDSIPVFRSSCKFMLAHFSGVSPVISYKQGQTSAY
jgi:hypothetical protein